SASRACRPTRGAARSTARSATSADGTHQDGQRVTLPAPAVTLPALAGDLARLDARGAHVQAARGPVHLGPDGLDVGVEAARGAAVRVRDPVTETRPLAANVADGSHAERSLV